jgi:hypothetical protein
VRLAILGLFIGLIGLSNTTWAATCEDALVSSYQCSYVADDGSSGPFAATISNPILGDGFFDMLIGGVYLHQCTCTAAGSPLAPAFGRSRKSFVCRENTTGMTGTVKRGQISGETYNTAGVGVRTTYICDSGQPPPPPPPLEGVCCEFSGGLCEMTNSPNVGTFGCHLVVANETCSGNGKCVASKPRPGDCCQDSSGVCHANQSALSCTQSGQIFHPNSLCTVHGCVP